MIEEPKPSQENVTVGSELIEGLGVGRSSFEQWYVTHAFDYEKNPIGSRECGLQWEAWRAATVDDCCRLRDELSDVRCEVVKCHALLQQALNALEYHTAQTRPISGTEKAITNLREWIDA